MRKENLYNDKLIDNYRDNNQTSKYGLSLTSFPVDIGSSDCRRIKNTM